MAEDDTESPLPDGEASGLIMEQILETLDEHGQKLVAMEKQALSNNSLLREVVAMLKEFGTEIASLKVRCGRRLESCSAAMQQMSNEIKGDGKDAGGGG